VVSDLEMDDPTLLREFASCALPREEWSHRLHVRMGYLFLRDHPFDEALDRLRAGLQRYNRAHGVADDLTSGYHETLTVAWLRLIASRMAGMPRGLDSDSFCGEHPDLLDRPLLRRFYSPGRIASWEAKRRFVEPDLRELPAARAS
jgi:hypothetical protein